jgi:oligoribonuclease
VGSCIWILDRCSLFNWKKNYTSNPAGEQATPTNPQIHKLCTFGRYSDTHTTMASPSAAAAEWSTTGGGGPILSPESFEPDGNYLFFLDCEFTGNDADKHHLLEIYFKVTTNHLQFVDDLHIVLARPPEDVVNAMSEWCQRQHNYRPQRRGLTTPSLMDEVAHASVTVAEASVLISQFIDHLVGAGNSVLLAGFSVHYDRAFLIHHMPDLASRLHHRILDVSSIKACCERFGLMAYIEKRIPKLRNTHRARSDTDKAIAILAVYKAQIFDRVREHLSATETA